MTHYIGLNLFIVVVVIESFKIKCNVQVASLVLVKVKQSDKIFGGYSSIGLNTLGNNCTFKDGYRFYKASDNFIFSFSNSEDIQNMKISRVVNDSKAIIVKTAGFNFGFGSLCMIDQNLHLNNYSGSYENVLDTDTVFTIEEIETFVLENQ